MSASILKSSILKSKSSTGKFHVVRYIEMVELLLNSEWGITIQDVKGLIRTIEEEINRLNDKRGIRKRKLVRFLIFDIGTMELDIIRIRIPTFIKAREFRNLIYKLYGFLHIDESEITSMYLTSYKIGGRK